MDHGKGDVSSSVECENCSCSTTLFSSFILTYLSTKVGTEERK